MVGSIGYAVRKKRKLGTSSARHLHLVDLHSVSEARSDQNLPLLGMPAEEVRSAVLGVAIRTLGDRCWYRWNVLSHQVFVRSDRRRSCALLGHAKAGEQE